MIYLDHNATTPPTQAVVDAVAEALRSQWANPSSVHRAGQSVRQQLELARQSLAQLVGTNPKALVFTSGGTESNNLALAGVLQPIHHADHTPVLVTSRVEHAAVREPAEAWQKRGIHVHYVPTDPQGVVTPEALQATLDELPASARGLASFQWANNETGVVQPIAALADTVKQHAAKLLTHCDATQAVGKLPVDFAATRLDLMTFAGHKFHGPKGVGTLVIRPGVRLMPQTVGGPQETQRRGGTENVPGIIGMGVAAAQAQTFLADPTLVERQRGLRDRFEQAVLQHIPDAVVNSGQAHRLWNTSNLGFPGLQAEAILLGLSEKGLYASAGAACSSGSLEPSPVLLAMGVPEPIAHGSVRFSLSRDTTQAEVDQALEILPAVIHRLKRVMPMG